MAKYLNKEIFLQSMGLLGDETKYGNRDGEHQNRSYSTWMGYEIMDSVDDSIVEEDIVSVVRCKDCKYCRTFYPVKEIGKEAIQVWYCDLYRCSRKPDEFCSDGERREGE